VVKDAFSRMRKLLRGKLKRNLKKRIIRALTWSVVQYGTETWTMGKEAMKEGWRPSKCEHGGKWLSEGQKMFIVTVVAVVVLHHSIGIYSS